MKLIKFLYFLSMILIITSCTSNTITYKNITAEEAYQMIEDNNDVIILDVRTSEEYAQGYIENAINVPYDELSTRFESEVTTDKETIILVYCRSGRRSTEASEILTELGYTNVHNFGGIIDWTYGLITEN